jgi:hypothetical protein
MPEFDSHDPKTSSHTETYPVVSGSSCPPGDVRPFPRIFPTSLTTTSVGIIQSTPATSPKPATDFQIISNRFFPTINERHSMHSCINTRNDILTMINQVTSLLTYGPEADRVTAVNAAITRLDQEKKRMLGIVPCCLCKSGAM